jgi:hypothetical protein
VQDERTGADPDERHARVRGAAEEGDAQGAAGIMPPATTGDL